MRLTLGQTVTLADRTKTNMVTVEDMISIDALALALKALKMMEGSMAERAQAVEDSTERSRDR